MTTCHGPLWVGVGITFPCFLSFCNFYFLVYILTVYIILSSACTQQINPSTTEFSYFGSGICSRLLQRSCFLRNMNKALSPATFFRHFRISRGFPPFISGLVSIQMDVTSKVPPSWNFVTSPWIFGKTAGFRECEQRNLDSACQNLHFSVETS